MKIRLLHDWILVRVEPARERTSSGLFLVGAQPIRMAEVLATGPGKVGKFGCLKPVQVKPGDRFPFFKASTESKQGQALALYLEDDQALVREPDVLFLMYGEGLVEL